MQCLDLTLPTPAENLACDEALLDSRETGQAGEVLRFWEARDYFVVVGYANRIADDVRLEACAAAQVPVLRRCSGGGTVLQGPGCLNYSLILEITPDGPLRSIATANQFIMERNAAAIESAISSVYPQSSTLDFVQLRGHTDLALGSLKFSGNAQRRRKRWLLFHGTFLLRMDLASVETYLPVPARQPDYRQNRAHRKFLTNLELPADAVKRALREGWSATERTELVPRETISGLVRDKYATDAWSFKF